MRRNSLIAFALTASIAPFPIFAEDSLGIDDISRTGGVALQGPSVDSENGTLSVGDLQLGLGADSLQSNYTDLALRYSELQDWFENTLDSDAGQYEGIGRFLWGKINQSAAAPTTQTAADANQESMQELARTVVIAQSLKQRHLQDQNLIGENAPEHEFYFRLVSNPGGRLFALKEYDDSGSSTPAPVKVRIATQNTGLRVRGLLNRDEVLGSLPKNAVVDAEAVMLKGLLPVGYRVLIPNRTENRNGFVAGAYVAVEDGEEVSVMTGGEPRYARLKGKAYLFEKIWQSVATGARNRAGLVGDALAANSQPSAPALSTTTDFFENLSNWSTANRVSEALSPLSTPQGGLDLPLAPELQELAEDERFRDFFDPTTGISQEKLQTLMAQQTSAEEVQAIEARVVAFTQRYEEIMQSQSLQNYLRDARNFRTLEAELPQINAPMEAIATSGVSLENIDEGANPELHRLASILNDEELAPYLQDGRMNLSTLASRFANPGEGNSLLQTVGIGRNEMPIRASVLRRLQEAAQSLRSIDVGRLSAEVHGQAGAERPVPEVVAEEAPAQGGAEEAPAPLTETPDFTSARSFARFAFAFVPNIGGSNVQAMEDITQPSISDRSHRLIFSYRFQKHMAEKLNILGPDPESYPLTNALFFDYVGPNNNATVLYQDNYAETSAIGPSEIEGMRNGFMGMKLEVMELDGNPLDFSALGAEKGDFFNEMVGVQYTGNHATTLFALYILKANGQLDRVPQDLWAPALEAWRQVLETEQASGMGPTSPITRLADALIREAGALLEAEIAEISSSQ